jgi:hypothetical protein
MSEMKPAGWQNVRQQLNDWSKPALIALGKDLYDASWKPPRHSGSRPYVIVLSRLVPERWFTAVAGETVWPRWLAPR